MTPRSYRRLAAVTLVGLVVLAGAIVVATSHERERRRRPTPPLPTPVIGAWAAHAQRVVTTKPPKSRRPDRRPRPKAPRLGNPSAATSACASLSSIPVPGDGEIIFVASAPVGGNNALILRSVNLVFDVQIPCSQGNHLVAFPERALLFGADAALLVLAFPGPVLSFWGAEPFDGSTYFPDTGPEQSLILFGEVSVLTPRALYAAGAACPYCTLGDIRVSASDQPTLKAAGYNRVHNLTHADLTGATLSGTFTDWNLTGANLTGANLTDTTFTAGTQLADANFSGATLDGAVFQGSDLTGANFKGARWDPARPPRFEGVHIGRSDSGVCTQLAGLDLLEVPVVLSIGAVAAGCESVPMFPGSLLRLEAVVPHFIQLQLDLSGAYVYVDATNRSALAGANLTGVRLDGLTLVGFPADLTRTVFDGASMIGASFDLADFAGASLHDVDALGASFRGARFSAHGSVGAASFAGAKTNLVSADFVEADVSGASFVGATLTGAVFSQALAVGTNFNGVSAANAIFTGAHVYGDGQAFNSATTLAGADFANALLAGDVAQSGGFDFTQAELTGAKFDSAQCIGCNFTAARLKGASFTGAYLLGANFASAQLDGASLFNAWLYCGDLANGRCPLVPPHVDRWQWALQLGFGEAYGPVPFPRTDLATVNLAVVAVCPDGESGTVTAGCAGHLLPEESRAPAIPSPCSAAGLGSCPEPVSTLLGDGTGARPLATTPLTPAYWATPASDQGVLVAFDDSTVRTVTGDGRSVLVAGIPGQRCPSPTASCGDGRAATAALLGQPGGLAVDGTGAVYIADTATRRIRQVDVDGNMQTVAGTGGPCGATDPCGDGDAARAAELHAANDVWADPVGNLWIADGPRGIRLVTLDGLIYPVPSTAGWNVIAVTGDVLGTLYAATQAPDHLLQITHDGKVTIVVGTGTSGFNGNMNDFGFLLPGIQVQINRPGGLSTGLDGTVFFADSANNLLRAYAPGNGHVIEVGGLISDGMPLGGFNDDGQWADQTKFNLPADIAATATGLFVVADTANARVRQFGRSPPGD